MIDDCLRSIELKSDNMKGYYYLAQAQLALHHQNEALQSALTAYKLCLYTNNGSAGNISSLILEAKKEKWEAKERERLRRHSPLLVELEDSLAASKTRGLEDLAQRKEWGDVSASDAADEEIELETKYRESLAELRRWAAAGDPSHLTRREVPDYMIDNISFAIMHDPVMTKNGQSYERATIERHLTRSETDPLTRQHLAKGDLRTNLALKQACAEFLEENGWAVDW